MTGFSIKLEVNFPIDCYLVSNLVYDANLLEICKVMPTDL